MRNKVFAYDFTPFWRVFWTLSLSIFLTVFAIHHAHATTPGNRCGGATVSTTNAEKETVMISVAKFAPEMRQCTGICYFETYIGGVQEMALKVLVKNGIAPEDHHYLAKAVPMAKLLLGRTESFLNSQADGNLQPMPHGKSVVDFGSPAETAELFRGMDIPIFHKSLRPPDAGVAELIAKTQNLINTSISEGKSKAEVLAIVKKSLQESVDQELSNPLNSDIALHLDDGYALFGANRAMGSLHDNTAAGTVQLYVSQDMTTFVRILIPNPNDAEPFSHWLRLAGYKMNKESRQITEVIVLDSDPRDGKSSLRGIPVEEFSRQVQEMVPFAFEGQFINRSSTSNPIPD